MLMSKKPGKIGGTLLLCLTRPLALLPLGFHRACGRVLGRFIGKVVRYRRDVVMINLAKSFPEKRYDELAVLCDRFYEHLGTIIGEALWFGGCTDAARLRRSHIVEIENPELLNRFFAEGRSVCAMYSHNGNWELIGGLWCFNYDPKVDYPCEENHIKVVYKRLHSRFWDEVFVRNRIHPLKNYDGPIESRNILRYAIKHRDVRNVYIYPTDQYPYAASHDVGSFLNQPSKVMLGSAALAHKLGMNVLYLRMKQVSRGRYEMTFVPICRNAAEMEPEAIMRKYLDLLEGDIRETPHNWLWSHKRWKK